MGPIRRVVDVIPLGSVDRLELECGHATGRAAGLRARTARCVECAPLTARVKIRGHDRTRSRVLPPALPTLAEAQAILEAARLELLAAPVPRALLEPPAPAYPKRPNLEAAARAARTRPQSQTIQS